MRYEKIKLETAGVGQDSNRKGPDCLSEEAGAGAPDQDSAPRATSLCQRQPWPVMTKPQCKYCGKDHTIEDCPDLALGPDHLDLIDFMAEPEPESEQREHRREVVAELEADKIRDGDGS